MDYIELRITLPGSQAERDICAAELGDEGFESFIETEDGILAYIPASNYDRKKIESLPFFSEHKDRTFAESLIKSRNWNEEWEKSFQPVRVGDRCMIRASFHEKDPAVEFDIVINPNMSFGTGHHETTWLMVNESLDMNFENKSVLDMGCGTGVLAILASMLGAKDVLAIDVEDGAVSNSLDNIELNKVANITVNKGDSQLLADRHFHLILANINKNVLLADLPQYSSCLMNGGELLLSGFFDTDSSTITEKAAATGLTLKRKNLRNQWCLLHFVKPHASSHP